MFKIHSIFPFLRFFIGFMALTFAAGASTFGGGGGGSVLDTTVPNDGEGTGEGEGDGEADLEGAESDEGAGAGSGEGDETEGEGAEAAAAARSAAAAAKTKPGVTPEIAKALDAMKATNPAVEKEIRAKLYAGATAQKEIFNLKKDFPNGVADVMKLKTAVESTLGGLGGLKELGVDLKSYRELDKKWSAKDPTLAASLEAEYPEEFSAMVPHFINKYAEKSPEAYTKMYAGMVVTEIQGQNIPQALHLLNEYLTTASELEGPQAQSFVAKAVGIVGRINKWLGDLNTLATTPVPVKGGKTGTANDEDTQRKAALDLREAKQFNREVSSDYNSFRDTSMNKQLDEYLASKKKSLTPERREVVVKKALEMLSKKMHANPDFRETVQSLEKARDREGLIKFLKSRAGDALKGEGGKAGIVINAYRVLYGDTPLGGGKKKDAAAGAAGGNNNPGAGWVKLAKAPAAQDISRRLTEEEGEKSGLSYEQMVMKNKYVLRDGRKVFHD